MSHAEDVFATLSVVAENEVVETISLKKQTVTCGREEGDMLFDEVMMSSRHMQFLWINDGFTLVDLMSTNGTKVNGEKIAKLRLSHGDVIEVGDLKLVFDEISQLKVASEPPKNMPFEPPLMEQKPSSIPDDIADLLPFSDDIGADWQEDFKELIGALTQEIWNQWGFQIVLRCESAKEAFVPFYVQSIDTILGRSCAWAPLVDDEEASRRHARLRVLWSGDLVLEDLGSRNGTFVNGVAISSRWLLTQGDVVKIGNTVFRVEVTQGEAAGKRTPLFSC